ncbi:CBS domain-containing protein [Croceicoccus gelatinilyticus]|uniref:CBS domain-containing protein n=1 Tax=Croceicoccus gelatinilyticus TaxID=2835536 RepID=UPI001BCD5807|nr:CBS domain-containing protein [Croceicoccus gelatinilyticus]MBS7668138.1 CBS domain-containing protein [Croceicoccus gelatinilyticus]
MLVKDCMSRPVIMVSPIEDVAGAAMKMGHNDVGALPVTDGKKLVGMITDRDIAIRVVGNRNDPTTTVSDAMSKELLYCHEDDEVDSVLRNLADKQIRRLPVVDADKNLVGIISLSDLNDERTITVTEALHGITKPSKLHSQEM